jgi:hypothetical protein
MASGTRSKVSLSSSLSISDPQDVDESLEHDSRRYNSLDDRPRTSLQKKIKPTRTLQFLQVAILL